jgi:glycerophosphoryl diester phosphodiesterase
MRLLSLLFLAACIPLDSTGVPKRNPDFWVVGHRGAPNAAAENTLASFEAALALGASALEIDVCVTADGVAVLWHDRDPDDTVAVARQNGLEDLGWVPSVPGSGSPLRRPVDELTLAELRGSHGYARSGSSERDPAAQIPTLAELLVWARGRAGLEAVYLDLKVTTPAQAVAVVDQVVAAGLDGDAVVLALSTREEIVTALAAASPGEVRVVWDHEEGGALERSEALGLRDLSIGLTALRTETAVLEEVDEAVAAREKKRIDTITVWTLDEPMALTTFLFHEVDAILTNDPETLHRIWQATL